MNIRKTPEVSCEPIDPIRDQVVIVVVVGEKMTVAYSDK